MKKIFLILAILTIFFITHAQNVGIGTTTPGFPLNFSNALGDKISLYGNTGNHYGFGIQSGLMQIHSDAVGSNIAFGYGSSNSFTERMRILNNGSYDGMSLNGRLVLKNGSTDLVGGGAGVWLYKADNSALLGFMGAQNNQNVGFFGGPKNGGWGFVYDAINSRVGVAASDPQYLLDVNGRIRIRHANAEEPGIWLNNNTNTGTPAFIGLQNNNNVGFYGASGAGWGLTMNTQTGALKINGSEGTAGQVLQSNGNSAATWANKASVLYFNQSSGINLGGSALCVDIPSVNNQNFTLPQASRVTYQFTIPLGGDNGAFGGNSRGIVSIQILDGSNNVVSAGASQYDVSNTYSSQIIVIGIGLLNAGTYTIRARVGRSNSAAGAVYSNYGLGPCDINIHTGQLIMQIFPN